MTTAISLGVSSFHSNILNSPMVQLKAHWGIICVNVLMWSKSIAYWKPAFHVQISHILLQNDLNHQFFFGGRCLLPLTGHCPLDPARSLRGPLDPLWFHFPRISWQLSGRPVLDLRTENWMFTVDPELGVDIIIIRLYSLYKKTNSACVIYPALKRLQSYNFFFPKI